MISKPWARAKAAPYWHLNLYKFLYADLFYFGIEFKICYFLFIFAVTFILRGLFHWTSPPYLAILLIYHILSIFLKLFILWCFFIFLHFGLVLFVLSFKLCHPFYISATGIFEAVSGQHAKFQQKNWLNYINLHLFISVKTTKHSCFTADPCAHFQHYVYYYTLSYGFLLLCINYETYYMNW